MQDFATKVLADNLHMLLTAAADLQALHAQPTSRINRTYALGTFKPIPAGCLLHLFSCLLALGQAMVAIVHTRCRIQSGRDYRRPKRCTPHIDRAYRSHC